MGQERQIMRRFVAGIALLGAASLLPACTTEPDFVYLGLIPPLTESHVVASGWLPPTLSAAMEPVYCYSTLGDADCYEIPRFGEEGRIIAYRGPAPPTVPFPFPDPGNAPFPEN
jgi:hypothetical protein